MHFIGVDKTLPAQGWQGFQAGVTSVERFRPDIRIDANSQCQREGYVMEARRYVVVVNGQTDGVNATHLKDLVILRMSGIKFSPKDKRVNAPEGYRLP